MNDLSTRPRFYLCLTAYFDSGHRMGYNIYSEVDGEAMLRALTKLNILYTIYVYLPVLPDEVNS